jgi:hypothetical protein
MTVSKAKCAAQLWPLLDAHTVVAQFGTEAAQHHVLEGQRTAFTALTDMTQTII